MPPIDRKHLRDQLPPDQPDWLSDREWRVARAILFDQRSARDIAATESIGLRGVSHVMERVAEKVRLHSEEFRTLPFAERGILESDGERVRCGLCGEWYMMLATHLRQKHGMDPDDYREAAGLNRTMGLTSPVTKERRRAIHTDHLNAIRPEESSFKRATPEQYSAWSSGKRRPQQAKDAGRRMAAESEAHPREHKPIPERADPVIQLAPARERLVELRSDPAWVAKNAAALRRAQSHLTAEQIAEIKAAEGSSSKSELSRRFRVARKTITKIWNGEKTE